MALDLGMQVIRPVEKPYDGVTVKKENVKTLLWGTFKIMAELQRWRNPSVGCRNEKQPCIGIHGRKRPNRAAYSKIRPQWANGRFLWVCTGVVVLHKAVEEHTGLMGPLRKKNGLARMLGKLSSRTKNPSQAWEFPQRPNDLQKNENIPHRHGTEPNGPQGAYAKR
eukprot:Gb_20665 [translate_table: standard]